MAVDIPSSLKTADVSRFVQRAAQLEKFKPAVAYWCYYWVVKQIIDTGRHNADDASKQFTSNLMDKLEQLRSQNPEDDAISDDVAGEAFVEQFGMETFKRAENAVRANKASRQTADTFQAAAVFLELAQIWEALSPEMASRIKFSKFQAVRITRALKAGEDPNLSNPPPETFNRGEESVKLDPSDPEVQKINGTAQQPPSVKEEPEHDPFSLGPTSPQPVAGASLTLPGISPALTPNVNLRTQESPQAVSPLSQPSPMPGQDSASAGGYFPGPNPPAQGALSSTAGDSISPIPPLAKGPSAAPDHGLTDPQAFYSQPSVPPAQIPLSGQPPVIYKSPPPPVPFQSPPPQQNVPFSPPVQHAPPPPPLEQNQTALPAPSIPAPAQHYAQPAPTPQVQRFRTDDMAILDAQKHAKWAISALNFEDVPTAVKELRIALQALGAG